MGKHDTLAELFTRHYPCCFAKSPVGLPGSQSSPGNSGQSGNTTATFGMPPGFLDSGFTGPGGPAQESTTTAVDPLMAQMLRQQMLLTQGVMDPIGQDLDFLNNQCSRHQQ